MASMPQTPSGNGARGRSRLSKALPVPPNAEATAPTISPLYSAPLPTPKFSLPPLPKAIPRKAIGMTADQRALLGALSRATNSPMYSHFPAVPKPPTPASTSTSTSPSDDSSSAMDSSSGRESDATTPPMNTPPTLPPKDSQLQYPRRQTNRTPSPIPSPETTIAALQNSPPELWKRRSVKSDRSLHFDELKLERSNGSTASPPRQDHPAPKAKGPLPPLPRSKTIPPSRKPVPAPAAAPPPSVPMGAKISKLKDKASTSRSPFQNSSSDSRQDERPPTPDYSVANAPTGHNGTNGGAGGRKDIHGAHQDLQTNLRTPHTPPFEKDTAVPTIPIRSDSRTALSLLTNLLSHENESTSTLQAPTTRHSRQTSSETVTIRSPQPKGPDAHILLASPTDSSPIDLHSPIDLASPLPPSSRGSASASGDDARRGRSRQSMSTSHFPVLPPSILHPTDFILPALPLTNIQFDCYQNHKFMRATRNNVCPVACMLCTEGGTDMRWRCTWCCLSCCADCMKVLTREEVGKDLRRAREFVGKVGGTEGFVKIAD